MPRPEKVQAVEEIRERLTAARATFITEYRGLTVAEQQRLRADLRNADGEYRVVKMSLARLAADAIGLEALHEVLSGPTALAFAVSDPVTVAKALRAFQGEHERLIIKAGILAGEILPPEKVARLADIEPREVLLGRVAGAFKAPMTKMASLLAALPRNAASAFSQLLEKKEQAGEATELATADSDVTVEAVAEAVIDEVVEAPEVPAGVEEAVETEPAPVEAVAEAVIEPEPATIPKATASKPKATASTPKATASKPKATATTPKATATTPKAKATTPKAKATTPKATASTPKATATTPKAKATTPKAKASTPKPKPATGDNSNTEPEEQ
jgi:large subunit ribosomal protein L10